MTSDVGSTVRRKPTLIIVSGPPASGKTTLAHAIARAVPCPAICRDEIKEGMVHAEGSYTADWGGPIAQRTYETFFGVLELLLRAGGTVVAEAAFQDKLWRPKLEPMLELAELRIVHCEVGAALARSRIERRAIEDPVGRAAHPDRKLLEALDSGELSHEAFDPIALSAPAIHVDTTEGYEPDLSQILAFINEPGPRNTSS